MPAVKDITSAKNPQIKNVLDLRERKTRDKTGLMIVEGTREIMQAREAGVKFREAFFCQELIHHDEARGLAGFLKKENIGLYETSEEIFAKISFGERMEGILAVCEKPRVAFSDIKISQTPFLVVVEGVEKPGNLGAILRTADAAGVDGVILTDGITDVANPNVVRSSLGTVFSVKVVEGTNTETLNFLKKSHIKICAAFPAAKEIYTDVPLDASLAVILGSEQKGLSDFWKANADLKVKIPMYGHADSLNVSATAAVLVYEARRQRNLKK